MRNREAFRRFFDSKDFFLLDGDGTLYLADEPLRGAVEFLGYLKEKGKKFVIISNNDSLSYRKRLALIRKILGIRLSDENLVLPTQPLVEYLKRKGIRSFDGLVTTGLRNDLIRDGIEYDERNPDIVIVGFDTQLNYGKLSRIVAHINNGADYVLTHIDPLCPAEGSPLPDAGSLVKTVGAATGKNPVEIFGKPYGSTMDYILRTNGVDGKRAVVMGDRTDTDIAMAASSGISSILIAREKGELKKAKKAGVYADFVFPSLSLMVQSLSRK